MNIIIIIRQPYCPVLGRRPQHSVSKLTCLVLSSAISCRSGQYLSMSSLHRLAGLPCRIFLSLWSPSGDTRGPSVVLEADDLPCSGPFHFSHIADYIYDFCPLPDPDAGPSIFVCDVEHTSFHFGFMRPQVCSVLVWSVSRSLPRVIACSTQEDGGVNKKR